MFKRNALKQTLLDICEALGMLFVLAVLAAIYYITT